MLDYSKTFKTDNDVAGVAAGDIVKADPYSLERAKQQFQKYEDEIQKWSLKATELEVEDDVTNATATEMTAQVAGLLKQLDDQRKEIIKTPDDYVRSVNSFVRGFKVKLESIVKDLKAKVGDYGYKLELKRREDERKMQKAAAKKQAKLDAEAKKMKVEPVQMPVMVAPKKPEPVRTESGTASTRYEWDCEVVDIALVPRAYLEFNKTPAMYAIKSGGLRDIPGLRIFEKPIVTIRRG